MYVYIESETTSETGCGYPLYTVGHYTPDGEWVAESDHGGADGRQEAVAQVALLNGGWNRHDEDDEINAMAGTLQLLSPLTKVQQARVLKWLTDRLAADWRKKEAAQETET